MGTSFDSMVHKIIMQHNYNRNMMTDVKEMRLYPYFSVMSLSVFSWYPFKEDAEVLLIGSSFGSFSGNIAERVKVLDILEPLKLRADAICKRLEHLENVQVINDTLFNYKNNLNKKYDYIIFYIDETCDEYKSEEVYKNFFIGIKSILKYDGKLLTAMPNRFGVKYLCGERINETDLSFTGITDNFSSLYRFSVNEVTELLKSLDFENVKVYYTIPDHHMTQMVFTDECPPQKSIFERYDAFLLNKSFRIMEEKNLYRGAIDNDAYKFATNSFIIECGNSECSEVLSSVISYNRDEKRGFATTIYPNCVKKVPLFSDGILGLNNLINNSKNMLKREIPTLIPKMENGCAVMERVNFPTLSEHIYTLKEDDKEEFIDIIDKLYCYILKSSDEADSSENKLLSFDDDWGIILKKAYIEMIPANCFLTDKGFLYYDQEFVSENLPAKYVLFRCLRDIYTFYDGAEKIVPLIEMKKKYRISDEMWDVFQREEDRFQYDLQQIEVNRNYYSNNYEDIKILYNNRRAWVLEERSYKRLFDITENMKEKKVILFGAGKQAEYYLEKYGLNYPPVFLIDNSSEKWGTVKYGYEIKSPMEINKMLYGSYKIVIAMAKYEEVIIQLEEMGITQDYYCVYNKHIDELRQECLIDNDTVTDGKYNIGYVTGVFDLFHIGHLNILKRSKERCHYLIAGVLTDELTMQDKHKKPFIPFEERMEIVKQCKYVDRVIPVNFNNTDKIEAFKELHYGCLFSGSDHENEKYWTDLQFKLRVLGSELEFFPYTQGTSSTMLQNILRNECDKKGDIR